MTTDPRAAATPGEAPTDQPALENTPQAPPQPAAPPEQAQPGQVPPQQAAPPAAAPPPLPQHRIKRTRTSGIWVAVGFFAVVLLLLLIFILQNGTQVSVSYLGLHGHLPLGVALLLAAVCGVLLVVLAGAARISQLRATARRHRRVDAKRAAAAVKQPANH
jgi:lipopolysaccharide assembly protein A